MTTIQKNKSSAEFLKDNLSAGKKYLSISAFFSCLNGFLMIFCAWIMAGVIDHVLFKHTFNNDQIFHLTLLILIYALRAVLIFFAEKFSFNGANIIKCSVRKNILSSLFSGGPAFTRNEKSGSIVNAYLESVESLHAYYAQTFPSRITAAVIPFAIFIFILPIDVISAAILITTAPLIPFFMIWIGKGAESINQKQWRRMIYMGGHFLDVIRGLTTLKLFDATKREAKILEKISDDFRQDTMNVLRVAFLSSLALEFLATVSIAMIAVLIGFRLLWGEIDFLHGFFVLLLAPDFYLPLRKMGTYYHAKMEALGAAEKLANLTETQWQKTESEFHFNATEVAIKFNHVSFSYPDGTQIFENVCFEVKPGEKIALIGPSGEGKSTLLFLLLGFLAPQSGTILINDVPLESISKESWHKTVGWMPQSPHLFAGSIKDNLTLAKPDAAPSEIDDILRLCGAHDIASFAGENGSSISGGQMQRVAMARALLRQSPIFLFDEPTAHLDRETELILQQAIELKTVRSTVITAAHRASSINHADRIFLVGNKAVIEAGK